MTRDFEANHRPNSLHPVRSDLSQTTGKKGVGGGTLGSWEEGGEGRGRESTAAPINRRNFEWSFARIMNDKQSRS